jgi:hypothetical protein
VTSLGGESDSSLRSDESVCFFSPMVMSSSLAISMTTSAPVGGFFCLAGGSVSLATCCLRALISISSFSILGLSLETSSSPDAAAGRAVYRAKIKAVDNATKTYLMTWTSCGTAETLLR